MNINTEFLPIAFKNLSQYPEILAAIQKAIRVPITGIADIPTINSLVRYKIDHKIPGGNVFDKALKDSLFPIVEPKPLPLPAVVQPLVSLDQVKQFAGVYIRQEMLTKLNESLHLFDIKGPAISHFMAQCAHESGRFRFMKEIASGWGYDISQNPQKAKRLGNFSVGDGPKFKGVDPLQMTGKNNYSSFAAYIKDPKVVAEGCLYVAEKYCFLPSGFWWQQNKMDDKIAAGATAAQVSRQVNRGDWHSPKAALHEDQRLEFYRKAKSIWG